MEQPNDPNVLATYLAVQAQRCFNLSLRCRSEERADRLAKRADELLNMLKTLNPEFHRTTIIERIAK